MTVAFGNRAPETFSVDYTLGAKRYQGYLSTLPDGRIYVLPAFWHIASRRWVDWKEITPIPDGAHELRQIWNVELLQLPRHQHRPGLRHRREAVSIDVDRDGHRLRGLPRTGPSARRVDGSVGEGSGVEAGVRQQLEEPPAERHPEDLLGEELGAATHLRHVRLLPRQQEQRLHRIPRRRSLHRLRAAVSDQRADSRKRSARRVLARRTSESIQPPAGADVERLLQGRRDRLHQLSRRPRIAQRLLSQGQHQSRPQRRCAVHAVP